MKPWFKGFACGVVATVATIGILANISAHRVEQQTPAAVAATQEPAVPAEQPQKPPVPQSPWTRAASNIWAGVILYYGDGEQKMEVGEVMGGNDGYVDPITGRQFRGLKIRMKSGKPEWKDRDVIVGGPWYVHRDDPAIARMDWETYQH